MDKRRKKRNGRRSRDKSTDKNGRGAGEGVTIGGPEVIEPASIGVKLEAIAVLVVSRSRPPDEKIFFVGVSL